MLRPFPAALAAVSLFSWSACGGDAEAAVTAGPAAVSTPAGTRTVTGPYAHDNLQVWLVHGPGAPEPGRPTIPLAEALQAGLVVVHETGDVNELAIENVGKDAAVFVQAGDIVQGGKQDRTIGVDLCLLPQSGRVPLPSFCVEHGRWSARGALTRVADAPGVQVIDLNTFGAEGARFAKADNNIATNAMKKAVLLAADQSAVWTEVENVQRAFSANIAGGGAVDASSPTSLELTLNTTAVQTAVTGYVSALQDVVDKHAGAVGCVVAIGGRLDSADVYGSRALFVQLWPKLLRGAAAAALAQKDAKTAAVPTLAQVAAFLAEPDGEPSARDVHGNVRMTVGATAHGHVVESRAGSDLLHRSWLAR